MVRMDQRVTFQVPTLSSDGGGGQVAAWGNIPTTPTVAARVQPKSGREGMEEDRMSAQSVFEITIRNRTDINERMRIVWLGENYNIRAVHRQGGRPLYLKIEAERGAADLA